MVRVRSLVVVAVLLVLAGAMWLLSDGRPRVVDPTTPPLSARNVLGDSDSAGFERALVPRPLHFPQDHADHPDYRHEWWYATGNLSDEQGRRYGYQFTLFRFALPVVMTENASRWRSRQIYMGHFAVTDIAARRFTAFQRFSRAAVGLAGATTEPLRIWLEDWALSGVEGVGAWRIQAREQDVGIDLQLTPLKPPVLQGDKGLSQKGPEPGNASYYYSQTRLQTTGQISLAGRELSVEGLSWLDREWGTSALGRDVEGWDWFALQLEDGRDLMLYHLRRTDGTPDPHSAGVLVDPHGVATPLTLDGVTLSVTDRWISPESGVRYPSGWRLRLADQRLDLVIKPLVAGQEWNQAVRYWEGAVSVQGESPQGSIRGTGYVELTGYGREKGKVKHE